MDNKSRILNEIDSYLRTKTSNSVEDVLKDYPVIHKLFLKFNCIRASEAICERLFSYAGLYFVILNSSKNFIINYVMFMCLSLSFFYLCYFELHSLPALIFWFWFRVLNFLGKYGNTRINKWYIGKWLNIYIYECLI